ncbi:MAG TPA: 4-hydroxythreonine-4-phosphate dehydrogenase PdxA [Candidatus Atribacteria bacterium]|nr:4-hydroxythreonine-4-phosphate dehydrogenase PdxA [Candidatus Atribacteria bacterium]
MKKNNHKKPLIGVTMGDGAGIGPEVSCKTFMRQTFRKFSDIIVIGKKSVFAKTIKHYNFKINTQIIEKPEDVYLLKEDTIGIIEVGNNVEIPDFKLGAPAKELGEIALLSIDKAVDLAKEGRIDGIVTAPVNKEVISLSYKKFTGHTEYIAERLKTTNFNMMMVSSKIKVVLVTTHMPLKDVSKSITKEKIINTTLNTYDILLRLGYKKPKIAILGLNPHASDGGLFGQEEERVIIPAIEELRKDGIKVDGPYPPDSFFYRYLKYPVYESIIAMYHDQGLIPFKIFSFGVGINVTIGLPIIRTSVDHGTAYDIAGKGKAYDKSLFESLKFAVNLARNTDNTKRG